MSAATSARTGSFDLTVDDDSISQWVVIAPIARALPSALMPESPETLRRSMRCFGWASRSFIIGMRLWPPARILASSFSLPSNPSASLTFFGAWYWNAAGYMAPPLFLLGGRDGLPDLARRERHVEVPDPEGLERVHDRVRDRGRRGDRPGLARALDAERVDRARRHRAVGHVARERVGLRHRVVHHRAGEQLTVVRVDAVLPERLADALGDAAVDHAVDDHRVDDPADIVHGDVLQNRHGARLRVHLDHGHVGAEREREVDRIVERRRLEAGLHALGDVVREVGHQRHLAPRLLLVGRPLHRPRAALEDEVLLSGLEEVRGDLAALLLDLVETLHDGAAADARRAAAVGAHAERDPRRVAVDHFDLLHRDPELVGDDLGERRLVPLPVGVRAREDRDRAGRVDAHLAGP